MEQIPNDDKIYTVIKNITKNSKAVLSTLNGIEIGPGETVNLRAMFRKAQLSDATQEIFHFIHHKVLAEVVTTPEGTPIPESPVQAESPVPETPTAPEKPKDASQIQSELQKKIREAKDRELMSEISDCSLLSRLEDILTATDNSPEVKRAAKVQYMKLRGWLNDEGEVIEGSMDDDNNDVTSIDGWEFKPFSVANATGGNVIQ